MSNYPPNPPAYPQQFSSPGFPGVPPVVPREVRKYSIFGTMIRAPFFNSSVYRDVARNWTGIGFWYLFLLLLITQAIVMVKVHFAVAAFARNDFPGVVQDVPPITINAGHVTSPVDQPYVIKDPQSHKTFAVIDTTGAVNSMDDTDAMILLTDHKIWTRQNKNDIRQYDLSQIKYFYLDKAKLIGWMNAMAPWIAIFGLLFWLIGAMIFRLIQALAYGGINMALGSGFRANLSCAAAMRLAVVSVTPVILLDLILSLGGWKIPLWPLLGIGVSLLYMTFSVKSNGDPNPPAARGFPVNPPPGHSI